MTHPSRLGKHDKVESRVEYMQGESGTVGGDGILTLARVLYQGETSQFF